MNFYQKFTKNIKGNDYVIGDIHGQYDKLIKQLSNIVFDKKSDRLFAVGDLIDRGNQSLEVVKLLKENWFFSVLGNHEFMMLEVLKNNNMNYFNDWMDDGGRWIYGKDVHSLIPLIDKLPVVIEVDKKIGICHANPIIDNWSKINNDFIKENLMKILMSKELLYTKEKENIKNINQVFVGHNAINSVKKIGNINMIDTGSYFEKPFSIIKIN